VAMGMMVWANVSRDLVITLLTILGASLAAVLLGLVAWRAIDETRFLWRQRVMARYQPVVDALLTPRAESDVIQRLVESPARHRSVLAHLILAAARLQTGAVLSHLCDAARALGLIDRWRRSLDDSRWWVRAESVRALGLVREAESFDALLRALDADHEEVRAAAVDALGRLGDPRCGPALIARLRDESRHQRARLIEALRAQGTAITPILLASVRERSEHTAVIIDVLGIIGGTTPLDLLLELTGDDDPTVRAAALRAIGSIGLDDRSFYYALRGLEDVAPDARAMAARALGRSGRQTAVPYMAAHLDDEWLVAAHCATGLRRLGRAGAAALETAAASTGVGADLARQMVWELRFLPGH
jgi:HEAT repeat protein